MKIVDDSEITDEIMARLRLKYASHQRRASEGIHLTQLIYCITQAYWRDVIPFEPTDDEARYFAAGLGLEEVLLRDTGDFGEEPKLVDGIICSADYVMKTRGEPAELKTTRMYFNKEGEPTHGWPDTWIDQMMGYCHAHNTNTYRLVVFSITASKIIGKTFIFTHEEINDFWNMMLERKARLDESLGGSKPPEPFAYNKDWECNRCPAQLMCSVAKQSGEYIPKEKANGS